MNNRISELELILPSLFLMKVNNGKISTSELIKKLRIVMNPTGEDLKILSGRKDDKFSQKVRNLKAHNTFERLGYAEYENGRNAYVKITNKGDEYLKQNEEILYYLLSNNFNHSDLKDNLRKITNKEEANKIETFDENIIVQEGIKKFIKTKIYERSKKLRDYAIEKFTLHGNIECHACKFNFKKFYGEEIGKGFIEIHHVKPIFHYKENDINTTLKDALSNLIPVCSNCHRMIHRNRNNLLEINYLISKINENKGNYIQSIP